MDNLLTSHPHFPAVVEDSIDTIAFLDASKGLVWLIEQFGFAFEPVRKDFCGNIRKLNQKYSENIIEHKCLKRMILLEKHEGTNFATESLLWLRRGLSFMSTFLQIFLEKEREGSCEENLDGILRLAYERTLKPHHGIIEKLLFKALCRRCPKRSQFLNILGCPPDSCKNTFHSNLDAYLSNLSLNLEVLVEFHRLHEIKPCQ